MASTATTSPSIHSALQPQPKQPSFRDLFTFTTWRHSWLLIAGLVTAVLCGALKTGMSILLGKIFGVISQFGSGKLTGAETLAQVSSWCVLLVVVGGAGWLVNFAFMFSWIAYSELQARNIRGRMFRGLLKKEMEWFDCQEDGVASLLVRIQTQTRELQIASSVALGSLSVDIATSIANLIVALYTAWKLTLVLLASIPVSVLILQLLSRPIKPAIEAQKQELSRASKYAFSAISAIDLVKVFNGVDHETWQYLAVIKRSMQQYLIQARGNALQMGYVKFWIDGLFVVGFYYGAVLVDQGLSPGNVLTTFYAALAALQAIEAFVPMYLVLAKGISAAQALRSIAQDMEGGRAIHHMKGGHLPGVCFGEVEMRNISFAYPSNPSKIVLQKSSFHFKAGELSFIVGRSGSGKSTLGNLLMKFYEPLSGEILIDGRSIRTLDTEWLRKTVTLIQQTSILFNDTFFMNVAFGHKNPTRVSIEEVKAACETALLQSTISSLPGGLDTFVGAGGHNLSGGQKQRLALARAKLRDPPILILDEVTSGLDPVSRGLIMEAVRIWRQGKTTIIITHEVAQIKEQDFVYVMDDGCVVQAGFYSHLSLRGIGLFAQLLAASTARAMSTDGEVAKSRQTSSIVNFSRKLSEESQNGPLMPGTPTPGEGLRGIPQTSRDVFSRARRSSHMRLLGVQSRLHMDARGTLNDLAATALDSPRRGLSRMVATFSRQFTSTRPPTLQPTTGWGSTEQLTSGLSPIRTGSIYRLQQLGDTIQNNRNGSSASGSRHRVKMNSDEIEQGRRTRVEAEQSEASAQGKEEVAMPLLSIYKTVWPCLDLKEKMFVIVGVFMLLVVAGSVPGFSYVFANLLAALHLKEKRTETGQKWAIILLVIGVSGAVATTLSHYLLEWVGQAWINTLRRQAFDRVLRQPKAWFEDPEHSPSRINECLDRNAEEMRNLVGRFAPLLLVVVVMILSSVIWALAICWKLTLVSLASGPFLIAATKGYSGVSNKWELRCNKAASETSAVVTETFTNIRVVRALTLDKFFDRKHEKSAQSTFRLGIKKAGFTAALYACWQSMFWFMMALIFWYATVLLAVNREVTVQSVLQVVNLLVLGLSTASNILNSVPAIAAAQATASLLLYYTHLPLDASHETKGTKKLVRPLPIRLNGLYFTYPSQKHAVLRNLTLSFEAGTSTAIVGPSGCGKSTIASIILGLHAPENSQPDAGTPLTFCSVPFDQVDVTSLRSHMGYVPQTPFLFPASVTENIAYGLHEYSPLRAATNIRQAAREAGLDDFVRSLPDGYETLVGDGGQTLSGGQMQRVCIARALARRPGLLVLDEPTSALDAEGAEAVGKTIRGLLAGGVGGGKNGLCVVMVTHSQEMMRVAERVVLVDSGRVVETGGFDELMGRRGRFAQLVGGGLWIDEGVGSFVDGKKIMMKKKKTRKDGGAGGDLPLRSSEVEVAVRSGWIGAGDVDWDSQGPATGMLSPMASPFSRPSRRRERRGDGDV